MIIVSQSKETIINFENVEEIMETMGVQIKVLLNNGRIELLGEYATKERVKQILEDIHTIYGLSEIYKYSNDEAKEQIMAGLDKTNQMPFKYEMPAE